MFKKGKLFENYFNNFELLTSDRQYDDETDVSLKHPMYFIDTWFYEAKIVQLDMIFTKP